MPSSPTTGLDSLFSVELYIDRIRLSPSADCLFPSTLFKLLDFATQRLSECPQGASASSLRRAIASHERAAGGRRKIQLDELRDSDGNLRIRRGKSALFRMQPERLAKCLSAVPLYVFLVDAYHQPPKLTGVCSLALDGLAQEVLQHQAQHGIGVPVAREISGVFGLSSLMGHEIGLMTAKVRLASLGPSVAGHLPVAPTPSVTPANSKTAAVNEALATAAAATQTSAESIQQRGTQYPFPVLEASVKKIDDSAWLEDGAGESDFDNEIVDHLPDADFGDINDLALAAAEAAEAEALAAAAVFRDSGCGPVQPPPMFYNSRARQTPRNGSLPWTKATKQQQQFGLQRRVDPHQVKKPARQRQQQQQQQNLTQKQKKQPTKKKLPIAAKQVEDAKYAEVVRRLTQRQMQGPPEAAAALYTRRQIQQGRMPLLHGLLTELLAWSGEESAAAAAAASEATAPSGGATRRDGSGQSRKLRFLPRPLPARHRRRSAGDRADVDNNNDLGSEDSEIRRIRLGRSVSMTSLIRPRPAENPNSAANEFARPEQEFLKRLHDGKQTPQPRPPPVVPPSRSWIREAPRYRGPPATKLQFGLTATCVRRLARHNPTALADLVAQAPEQQQQFSKSPSASRHSATAFANVGNRSSLKLDKANLQRSAPLIRPQPSTKSPAPPPSQQQQQQQQPPPPPLPQLSRQQPQAKPRHNLTPQEMQQTATLATSATSMTSADSSQQQRRQQQQQHPPVPPSVPPLALQRSEDSVATASISAADDNGNDPDVSSGVQRQRQKNDQRPPLSSYRADESSDWQVTASASAPSSPQKPPLPSNSGGLTGSPAHRQNRRFQQQQQQQPATPISQQAAAANSEATQVTPDVSLTGRAGAGEPGGGNMTDSERRLAAQLSSGSLGSYQPSWMDDSLSDHASVSTSIDI